MLGADDLLDASGLADVEQEQAEGEHTGEAARLQERHARSVRGRLDDDAAAILLARRTLHRIEQPAPDAPAPVVRVDMDHELPEVGPAWPVEEPEPRDAGDLAVGPDHPQQVVTAQPGGRQVSV